MSAKILVLGASGMLGTAMCPGLTALGYEVLRQSRGGSGDVCLNPLDLPAVSSALKEHRPEVIINLISEINVDRCQSDMRSAYEANVRTVEILVQAIEAAKYGIHLIQISTDHVYDGIGPHVESAAFPINAYALTKYAGEVVAIRTGATVIRTNFFGRSQVANRVSFSDWIVSSLRSGMPFTVFDDVYFSALHMSTLIQCVTKAIELRHLGIFNAGSRGGMSKAQFAMALATQLGIAPRHMKLGSVSGAELSAPRPKDMRMDVLTFERKFGMEMPSMAHEISLAVHEYEE